MNTYKHMAAVKALALSLLLLVSGLAQDASQAADPNSFNRLMTPASKRNPPPPEDGIHDPGGPAVHNLQTPREAFGDLPKSTSGNYIDWVASLKEGKVKPRYDRVDPAANPIVMDLNIVREVKGSMPNVVYPHKQHTEWLDCSNCHPAIFIPQKGANKISMASILLGEKCGVCHGKVAFPVAECRRCHSQPKTAAASATTPAAPAASATPATAATPAAPAAAPPPKHKL